MFNLWPDRGLHMSVSLKLTLVQCTKSQHVCLLLYMVLFQTDKERKEERKKIWKDWLLLWIWSDLWVFWSPGSMSHLMGIVVESYDGFSLLYTRQYHHQSSVCHHQVQVVPGQVEVYSLTGKKTLWYAWIKSKDSCYAASYVARHTILKNY